MSFSVVLIALTLSIVGPPSSPVLNKVGQSDTYIRITWTIPDQDTVQYFQLFYSYEVRRCTGLRGTNLTTLSNHTNSYQLTNLEEDSDILITLTAVNQAGGSNPATIRTYTLPAGETLK